MVAIASIPRCAARNGLIIKEVLNGGLPRGKRRKESKVHLAVDTLGHLLALTVTPADQGDRDQAVCSD
jgi:hypothetical protein